MRLINDRLKSEVYEVFERYGLSYTPDGVKKNLEDWKYRKGWLVKLLRNHPNWDEEALSITWDTSYNREIDRDVVNQNAQMLTDITRHFVFAGTLHNDDRLKIIAAINMIVSEYLKTIVSEYTAQSVQETCGINCVVGQRATAVIGKIFKKYDIQNHPEYERRYARLADSLSPKKASRTTVLSVHPCDFLEMSSDRNSWSSCHRLTSSYATGTLSLMNDATTMVFYTINGDGDGGYHKVAKITRQLFSYRYGILLQSRLYPETNNTAISDENRGVVQAAITECMDKPNLWRFTRNHDKVLRRIRSSKQACNYKDYETDYFYPTVSFLKSEDIGDGNYIIVGAPALCICCGSQHKRTASLQCWSC